MKCFKPNLHDLIPAVAVILLAALSVLFAGRLLGGSGDTLTAEITRGGAETEYYVLSSLPEEGLSLTLENNGHTLSVLLERDGVTVLGSTCAGHDCMKTGKITKAGRSIICLPGRISIALTGRAAGEEIDIYAG